ncbi:MAG: TadE/TadG family type IV pilus assembly protein [Acidimicrobiia bacterium]
MNFIRGRIKSERGVAMVEFAFVLPLLALLVVGMVEMGFAFREKLLVDNGVQTAARTGSSLGQAEDADLRILEALEQSFAKLPANGDGQVLRAQVYRVNSDGSPDPTATNTYLYQYDSNPAACNWIPCPATEAAHGPWKPSLRDTRLDGGLDSLGVKVYYGHDWILGTGYILSDVSCVVPANCWRETAVMRLEPTE